MANNDFVTEESVRQLINELIAIESAAREAQINQEAVTREINDDALDQRITQEVAERQEQLRSLQNSVNQSITRIDGNVAQLQALFNQRYDKTTQLISNLNASFETKIALLDGLIETVNSNKAKLDIILGNETVAGSIAKTLFDAKAYTDSKVQEVLGGAPELLDTLKELADSLGNDSNFITTVNNSIQELRNTSASNKQDILNLLSQDLIKKKVIPITQAHIQQGYVELDDIEIVPDSIVAFINRLGLFEGEDFSVSEVGSKTRFIFQNNLLQNAYEELEAGDVLRVKYWTL
jgi:hypothetical protein